MFYVIDFDFELDCFVVDWFFVDWENCIVVVRWFVFCCYDWGELWWYSVLEICFYL